MSWKSACVHVKLNGTRAIMFDRYCGDLTKKVEIDPHDRAYLLEDGTAYLPVENLISFLSSINNESATRRVIGKNWKQVAKSALSYVDIDPVDSSEFVSIMHGEKKAKREDFVIRHHVARVMKGSNPIPNPKHRPVLAAPWSIEFKLTLRENKDLDLGTLKRIFEEGGAAVGLGTYRGMYGKFAVSKWDVDK